MSEKDKERRTAPFAGVLQNLRRGKTHRELSAELQALTQAVVDTGKPGTITLQIKVAKSKINGGVELTDTIAVKKPQADRAVSLFFTDDEFNLQRDDPRQSELPLGPVRVAEDADTKAVSQ